MPHPDPGVPGSTHPDEFHAVSRPSGDPRLAGASQPSAQPLSTLRAPTALLESGAGAYPSIVQFQILNGLLSSRTFAEEFAQHVHNTYETQVSGGTPTNLYQNCHDQAERDLLTATSLAPFYALDALITARWKDDRLSPVSTLEAYVGNRDSMDGITEPGLLANVAWKAGQPFRGMGRIERPVFRSFVTLDQGELEKDHIILSGAAKLLLERLRQGADAAYPADVRTRLFQRIDEIVSDFETVCHRKGISYSPEELDALRKTARDCMFCHADQKRKHGQPYFVHLLDVASTLTTVFENTDIRLMHLAFKHDLREDQSVHYELRKLYRENKLRRNAADSGYSAELLDQRRKEHYLDLLGVRMLSKVEEGSHQINLADAKGVKAISYEQLASPRKFYNDPSKPPYDDAWICGVQIVKLCDILANTRDLDGALLSTADFTPTERDLAFPTAFMRKILDKAIPHFVNATEYLPDSVRQKFFDELAEILRSYGAAGSKSEGHARFAHEITKSGGLASQLAQLRSA